MLRIKSLFIVILVLACGGVGVGRQKNQAPSIPESAARLFRSKGLERHYDSSSHLNPSFLRGDFDGDAKPDIAFLIKQKKSGKIGIAVCHSSTSKILLIGAGTALGNGGDNFEWMDIWSVTPKATAVRKVGKAAATLLKGDALHVEKSESASALIYWNGKRYVWRQQGD